MDERADVDVGEVFRGSYQKAPNDGAGNGGKGADDEHGHGFEDDQRQRKLHALTRAPEKTGDERDKAGHAPDDAPNVRQTDSDRLRRERIIGDSAQRYAHARFTEQG